MVYPLGLEGESARDAVARAVRRSAAARSSRSQPYNVSVEGIQAAAGPAAAALIGRRRQRRGPDRRADRRARLHRRGLRNNGVSPEQAQFLGMQRWDVSAEALAVPSAAGRGVRRARSRRCVAAFNGRYQAAYGEAPHELAGLAYDGIAVVGALIAQARAQGGSPFSTARLTQAGGLRRGQRRRSASLPNGLNQRNLAIIEVRDGQAVVMERAARTFDAAGF